MLYPLFNTFLPKIVLHKRHASTMVVYPDKEEIAEQNSPSRDPELCGPLYNLDTIEQDASASTMNSSTLQITSPDGTLLDDSLLFQELDIMALPISIIEDTYPTTESNNNMIAECDGVNHIKESQKAGEIDIVDKQDLEMAADLQEGKDQNSNDPDYVLEEDYERVDLDELDSEPVPIQAPVQHTAPQEDKTPLNVTATTVNNDNMEEDVILPERKRKKNNFSNWKKVVNKKLRMSGKAYLGYRRTADGKIFHDNPKEERIMGERCKSKACEKSIVRFCNTISDDQRLEIFDSFWSRMSWDQRKVYISNMVEKVKVNRRSKKDVDNDDGNKTDDDDNNLEEDNNQQDKYYRRNGTLKYYLVIDDKRLQVCQKMFLQTLGIKKWTIRYWISGEKCKDSISVQKHKSAGMAQQGTVTRASQSKILKKKEATEFAKSFLKSLAKMPSHYCRKSSSRLYLEPIFTCARQLYDIYKDKCKEEESQTDNRNITLSRYSFEKIFKDENLSLFQPKNDRCDTCSAYEAGNLSQDLYTSHVAEKDLAREEKTLDKEKAIANEAHVYTSDLQAVKLSPSLKASALYYKTKLNVHNFTMYNIGTKDATCFWFDESNADLEASVFASCVINKLDDVLKNTKLPVVLWSDGCGYQNRNAIYSNALLHLASRHNVQIEQKFLVKGHTQMECDSVHANIETHLKNKDIYLPSQYYSLTKEARKKPFPYESVYLTYSYFKNYSNKSTMQYESIRPGRGVGDHTVHDIRAIRYNPNGKIETKVDFSSAYTELPRRPKNVNLGCEFPNLYTNQRQIPKSKWKDLQDLKFVIPQDCHSFYDSLPFKN